MIREFVGIFQCGTSEDEQENSLRLLAEKYEILCERFDRTRCTKRDDRGIAMPGTQDELHAINKHAHELRRSFLKTARSMGFTDAEFHTAIRDVQAAVSRGYRIPGL